MKIKVNGQMHNSAATQLTAILVELGFTSSAIATVVNGDFIPREAREGLVLKDGDQLEVLAPMQGG
jgi:sulfur carrier protein